MLVRTVTYFKIWGAVIFGIVISISMGVFTDSYLSNKLDLKERDQLLSRVQTIAHLINSEDVAMLSGTSEDLTNPAYLRIKQDLFTLHNLNSGSRFIYLQRSNGEKLIFLADSEPETSEDYSPPGQVYEETSEIEFENYNQAVPFVEGPYDDTWGKWVSGYAPVWNNGKMVAIVGMDVSANNWLSEVNSFRSLVIMLSALAVFVSIFIGLHSHHAYRYKETLTKLNEYVLKKETEC